MVSETPKAVKALPRLDINAFVRLVAMARAVKIAHMQKAIDKSKTTAA